MITDYGQRFAADWRAVEGRAVAALCARGVGDADAREAVQEAAARALARQVPFEGPDDLCRWIVTVARRVAIDERRRRQPVVLGAAAADRDSGVDVAVEVEARMRLARVRDVFADLSPGERGVCPTVCVNGVA